MSWTKRTKARFEWTGKIAASKLRKRFIMPLQSLPASAAPPKSPVRVLKDIMIPMRDEARLCADVYLPRQKGAYPAILSRLPYGKREWGCSEPVKGKYWARKGYAYIAQDVRGKFKSEGVWEPFVNEINDGYDTIDWVSRQTWCNGRIGMYGYSYPGYATLAAAVSTHPKLVCIASGMTAANIHDVWMFNGGAFCLRTMGSWLIGEESKTEQNDLLLDYWHLPIASLGEAAKLRDSHYRQFIAHPQKDSFWSRVDLDDRYQEIKIPALHVGGWYDVFLKGTISDWTEISTNGEGAAKGNQWLVIGPDDHGSTQQATGRIGRLEIGRDPADPVVDQLAEFFDHWLKGTAGNFEKSKRVKIFVIGDNIWREESEWPPAKMKLAKYYLHSQGKANSLAGDGTLSTEPPASEPPDTYVYDPADPAHQSLKECPWYLAQLLDDRSRTERRNDVLVYTSPTLSSDLEITGPISLNIFVSSTSQQTDFMAKLVDTFPNGYAHMIQEGALRTSLSKGGAISELLIDLKATSIVVKSGHKLRVEIASSDFNRYDRALNSPGAFGQQSGFNKATQTIYHDSDHPSAISIPVIPRG